MVKEMEVQEIKAAVDKFNDEFKAVLIAEQANVARAIAARDTEAYRFAAGLLTLALLLKPAEVSAPFVDFLNKRGQRTAKDGDNLYLPFVKAICAVKVEDGHDEKWTMNPKEKSFLKYANIVRQLVEEHNKGNISGSVEDFIANYKWKDRTKLGALEARDRAERPNKSQTERVEKAVEKGRKANPVAIVDMKLGCDDGDVVSFWGVMKDGQLQVMDASVVNSKADDLYYKLGKSLPA